MTASSDIQRIGRRLVAGTTAAAVATGFLAGCDTTQAASPTAAASASVVQPSPTPSASPTAVAPQWTTTMDEVSVDGATAVGEYFLELYPYVHATGDTTTWRALSHPDCLFCADVAQAAENPPEGGYVGASVSVQPTQGVELDPGVAYSLEYSMVFTSEAPVVEYDVVSMVVVRESDRWLVRGVEVVAADTPDA